MGPVNGYDCDGSAQETEVSQLNNSDSTVDPANTNQSLATTELQNYLQSVARTLQARYGAHGLLIVGARQDDGKPSSITLCV
jgi:hypothetical protein